MRPVVEVGPYHPRGTAQPHELLGTPLAGRATYRVTLTDPPGTRYSLKIRPMLPDGKWGDFSWSSLAGGRSPDPLRWQLPLSARTFASADLLACRLVASGRTTHGGRSAWCRDWCSYTE